MIPQIAVVGLRNRMAALFCQVFHHLPGQTDLLFREKACGHKPTVFPGGHILSRRNLCVFGRVILPDPCGNGMADPLLRTCKSTPVPSLHQGKPILPSPALNVFKVIYNTGPADIELLRQLLNGQSRLIHKQHPLGDLLTPALRRHGTHFLPVAFQAP